MAEQLWNRALRRIRWSSSKYLFERTAAAIFDTAPLPVSGDSPLFLSQMCHRDMAAYLLAIKSLYRAVGQGRVMIVNDGSLTKKDLSVLRYHVPGLVVIDIATIDTGSCPRGGTWERLVKIIELTAEHYVIQVDADTLVSAPIPEVVECWRNNKSFLLGTDVGQRVAPAPEFANVAKKWIEEFNRSGIRLRVETLAEAALDSLPDAQEHRYVHASSGFAGFAKGAFRLSDLEGFSAWMRERLGDRWDEWGSEQIASNYMLSNAADAVVLPFSRYACFEPHIPPGDRPFLHFYGTYRYRQGLYRKRVRAFLAQHNDAPAEAVTGIELQNP